MQHSKNLIKYCGWSQDVFKKAHIPKMQINQTKLLVCVCLSDIDYFSNIAVNTFGFYVVDSNHWSQKDHLSTILTPLSELN